MLFSFFFTIFDLQKQRSRFPPGHIRQHRAGAHPADSSRQSRSLSVARQMPARASTAVACRAYRTKKCIADLLLQMHFLVPELMNSKRKALRKAPKRLCFYALKCNSYFLSVKDILTEILFLCNLCISLRKPRKFSLF